MSFYDEYRKKKGLTNPSKEASSSFYDQVRQARANMTTDEFYSLLTPVKPESTSTKGSASSVSKSKKQEPKKKKEPSLLDNIGQTLKNAYQALNPFDDVSFEQAVKNQLNMKVSKGAEEINRFGQRAFDSALLGAPGEIQKKVTGQDAWYRSDRKGLGNNILDFASTGVGYLLPGIGATKGLKALGLGAKEAQGLSKVAQLAKEGALTGAGLSAAEVGVREAINPQDYSAKDNLKYIGLGTATGAIADPLAYGIGKGIGKLFAKNQPYNVLNEPLNKIDIPDYSYHGPIVRGTASGQHVVVEPQFRLNAPPPEPTLELGGYSSRPALNSPDLGLPEPMTRKVPTEPLGKEVHIEGTPLLNPAVGENVLPNFIGGGRPFSYWQKRLQEFTDYVNSRPDSGRLTQEALRDLWTQFAKYDEDVTLDELIQLGTPTLKNIETYSQPEGEPLQFKKSIPLRDEYVNYTGRLDPQEMTATKVEGRYTTRPTDSGVKVFPKTEAKAEEQPYEFKRTKIVTDPHADALRFKTKKWVNREEQYTPYEEVTSTVKEQPKPQAEQPKPQKNEFAQQVYSEEAPQTSSFKRSETTPKQPNERGFINTLKNSEKTSDSLRERLKGVYQPLTNEEVVARANERVKNLNEAIRYVKNARKLTAEHVATAHRLIDELQKIGDIERAVEIAEHIAEAGTRAGQAVQAFSIYNRLTPEGILVHAQRIVNKVNQKIGALGEKVKLTEDTAAKLTDLASTVQRMAGTEEAAKDVVAILEKGKRGEKLTDDELKELARFVNDARQFVKDITPKAKRATPKKVTDKRIRDNVVDFMSKQEELARKRIAARRNRVNSLPVDEFYDYAVIGAAKIAKGTVKFADFAEEMIREFGEEIRPYIEQIYDKAVETFNLQSDRISGRRLSEVEKITNKALKEAKLTEEEANIIREMARKVAQLSGDARIEASQELQATLMLLERPSFLEKVSTAQTIMQLLNPKTTVRNALGNELFYRIERLSKYIATPIDIARSKITGTQRTVTFRTNNQGRYWQNWLKGWKAGWRGVNPEGLQTQYDLKGHVFSAKWNPLAYLQKVLGATIQSFDYAAYKRAVNHTLGELATLRAINEGLKGKELKEAAQRYMLEADQNLLDIADAYGKYVTFQDNTALAVGLQRLKRAMNFGKDFGFGDLVLKYPKTPANLLMRAMEYSPAGFLRSTYLLAEPILKGVNFNSSEFAMSLARAITGTAGFTGLGYFLADKGILSGSGDKDQDIRQLEQMAGKRQYSVNVDALNRFIESGFNPKAAEVKEGDTYISYDWAQPLAIALSIGANMDQTVKEGELNAENTIYSALDGGIGTLTEQSVLQGVKKAFETYPGQSPMDKIVDIAGDLPSSFVPTFANQIRQVTDNTSRSTYDPNQTQSFMNRAINRVPSLEKILPPAYDTLGNKKETYQNGSNNLFNVFLNPAFVSQYKPSKEAQFVLNVINQTGDKTVAPRTAQKKITVDGKQVELSAKQYSEYQRLLGQETRKGIQSLLPEYKNSKNFEEIAKALDRVLRNANKRAKSKLNIGKE